MSAEQQPPVLRVVRGNPTAEDVAALVTVLAAAGGGDAPAASAPASQWAASGRPHGAPVAGRGAWRASALPR
ncbi:MAG TPA: acyl-CoA carboxylase epsilon subunit [Angustibacter sp.]|nr:acyl-CoA carboxylase epsilon subunit [Angustibacter sp.]